MINWKFGTILFLLGLLIVVTPRYIFPVCEYQGYNPMRCSHTGIAEMFTGFIVMASSAGMFFSRSSEALRWLSFTIFASGLAVLWIPEAIGYCRSSSMPCNYGTVPVLRLISGLIILLSLAGFFLSLKREKK